MRIGEAYVLKFDFPDTAVRHLLFSLRLYGRQMAEFKKRRAVLAYPLEVDDALSDRGGCRDHARGRGNIHDH